ncbi:lipopolysaccharide biosynthesis protein [Metabacillus halosaccharovorans]|uniref:lipopolysaccharide biosynthesis protein n=1 Tax=Metabacillus halosaccharovorans TaxID=930124 RepID=UPI0037351F55
MRTVNSMKNISIGIFTQIVMVFLGFISRKVFIDSLGVEYLGINGLLTNVLSMLALVESGIGTSIVYLLYKPLSENDRPKVIALIQLYKKLYLFLSIIILVLSLILYPFLDLIIKGSESLTYISLAYFIFVFKNMFSYFNAHKVSLISADQKGYILARVNLGFSIFSTVTRIFVLVMTENYILYLLIELVINFIQIIFHGRIVDKRYPYIKTKVKYFIHKSEKSSLITNVKAIFLHNVGGFAVHGTDNILISTFVGIGTVGIFSNYTMIIGQLGALLSPILNGVGDSVGNLVASESDEKKYSIFKVIYFLNFWLYSVSVVLLYNLIEPLINWWLGKGLLLSSSVLIIILVNFFINGLRTPVFTFKAKSGIFVQDKYTPLFAAAVNLIASIILVKYFGLFGIFLGTTISILSIIWIAPSLVYSKVFNKPVWPYFTKFVFYSVLTLLTCFITSIVCDYLILENSFLSLVVKGIICLLIPNSIYIALFYKSQEFQYLLNIVLSRIKVNTKLTSSIK